MAMAAPLKISRHGLLGSDSLEADQIEEFGQILDACRDEAEQALENLEARIVACDQDKNLSVLGKAERHKQLGQEALSAILKIGQKRKALESYLDKARNSLPEGLPERKRTNDHMASAQEIREHFQRLPILERRVALMAAADLDDVLTILAIKNTPPAFQLVPQEAIEKAIARWKQVNFAEQFERVQTIENVISTFDSNLKSAERIVSQRSGYSPAD